MGYESLYNLILENAFEERMFSDTKNAYIVGVSTSKNRQRFNEINKYNKIH